MDEIKLAGETQLNNARMRVTILPVPQYGRKVIGCGLTPNSCGQNVNMGGRDEQVCNLMKAWRTRTGPICGSEVPALTANDIRRAQGRLVSLNSDLS